MRPGPAGITGCPVNILHEVKFLSSNACQSAGGIRETSDLLCWLCIYRSNQPAANHLWQPWLANFKFSPGLLLKRSGGKRLIIPLRSIVFLWAALHIHLDMFLLVAEFVGVFVGFMFRLRIFFWDNAIGKQSNILNKKKLLLR